MAQFHAAAPDPAPARWEIDPRIIVERVAEQTRPRDQKWLRCPACGRLRAYPIHTDPANIPICVFCAEKRPFLTDGLHAEERKAAAKIAEALHRARANGPPRKEPEPY